MLLYTGNTAEFTPLEDVYSKFGNSYIKRVATVFVMTMVLIQVINEDWFYTKDIVLPVMKERLKKGIH